MGKLNLSNFQEKANQLSKDIAKKSQSFSGKIKEVQKSQKTKNEKENKKRKEDWQKNKKIYISLIIIAVIFFGYFCIIYPITAHNKSVAEDRESCKKSWTNLEENGVCGRSEYKNEDFYYTKEEVKAECEKQGRVWGQSEEYSWEEVCYDQEKSDKIIAERQAEEKLKEEEESCTSKNYLWNSSEKRCYTDEEMAKYRADQEEIKRKNEERKAEEERKAQQQQSAPTPASASNKPSIDEIADACWLYGQTRGVHLTDYASSEIKQDGNYYQILMWHDNGSVWKCLYNPSDKDVFIEKTR